MYLRMPTHLKPRMRPVRTPYGDAAWLCYAANVSGLAYTMEEAWQLYRHNLKAWIDIWLARPRPERRLELARTAR